MTRASITARKESNARKASNATAHVVHQTAAVATTVATTVAATTATLAVEIVTLPGLKELFVATLEFFLSLSLVLSFFECVDASIRDEQELEFMYTTAWGPFVLGAFVAYGNRLTKYAPSLETFERNVLWGKLFVWVYGFIYLVYDKDFTIKSGPALQVSIIFCVVDITRFCMELFELIEEDEEEDEHGANGEHDEFYADDDPEAGERKIRDMMGGQKPSMHQSDSIPMLASTSSMYKYVEVVDGNTPVKGDGYAPKSGVFEL